MPPRSHLILVLVTFFYGCLPLVFGGSRNVAKIFQPKANIPPAMMQMLFGGELDRRVSEIYSKVPNKMCVTHLKAIGEGARKQQLWALNMLDASAKIPEGILTILRWHFGNFEQCLRVQNVNTASGSFSGQHCMVHICLSTGSKCEDKFEEVVQKGTPLLKHFGDPYFNVKNIIPELKKTLNTTSLRIGNCVPSTCSPEDIEALFNGLLSQVTNQWQATVSPEECHVNKEQEFELLDQFSIAVYTLMMTIIICSTVYDLTHEDQGTRKEAYVAFSAYTNLKKIFTTSENSEANLQCVHGIRFLSIMYVVLGHVYFLTPITPITNLLSVNEFTKSKTSMVITAGLFSVDSFFVLSGLLVGYVFLNLVAERNSVNFKAFYIHRFIRLTPALAGVLLFETSLVQKLNDGPYWHTHYVNDCKIAWWQVLFYVKNYNAFSTCMSTTWYLSVDTQLYFLSPLLLLPMWKNPRRAQQLLAVAIFFSWLIPFLYGYIGQYKIPARPVFFLGDNIEGTILLYMGTQNRFGPWVVGLWLGLILHRIRTGQLTVKMNKAMVVLIWVYVFMVGYGCMLSMHPYIQMEHEYSRFKDSFFYSMLHLLWASVIFLMIFACVTGYGGPINWFLSLRLWLPWSRLTYPIYLVHYSILYILDSQIRTPQEFTHPLLLRKAVSVLFLSIIAGAVVSLMFESPITAVERIFLKKERHNNSKPHDVDSKRKPNGYAQIQPAVDATK